jgi:hypothetical protein
MWEAFFCVIDNRVNPMLRPAAVVGQKNGAPLHQYADGRVRPSLPVDTVTKSRAEAARYLALKCQQLSEGCVEAARHAVSSVLLSRDDGRVTATTCLSQDGTPTAVIDRVVRVSLNRHGMTLVHRPDGTVNTWFGEIYDSRREGGLAAVRRLVSLQKSAQEFVDSLKEPPFEMGRLVPTPSVASRFSDDALAGIVSRHIDCDWGEVCDEDWDANDLAVETDERLLSAYTVNDERLWVITEADRSVTTILRPEEY